MKSKNMPPQEHRFKKGQSGNPQGRPKTFEKEVLPLILSLSALLIRVYQKDKAATQKLADIKKILLIRCKQKEDRND